MQGARAYLYVGPTDPVLATGKLFIDRTAIVQATNQSTGYCPEPNSWPAVAKALDAIGVSRPDGYTSTFVFRRCLNCGQLDVVKDEWFECDVCAAALPEAWNCDQ